MATTTLRCPAEQAKAGIDQMLRVIAAHRHERDPIGAVVDALLEMRQALNAAE